MRNRYYRSSLFCRFGDERYEETMEDVMEIELEFIKKFNRATNVEHKLNNCATGVLNYYLQTMKKDNRIRNQPDIRQDMIQFIKKTGGKEYAEISISKAVADLSKLRIILSTDYKGVYFVNPLLYSKANESERKQLIQDLTRDKILFEIDFK